MQNWTYERASKTRKKGSCDETSFGMDDGALMPSCSPTGGKLLDALDSHLFIAKPHSFPIPVKDCLQSLSASLASPLPVSWTSPLMAVASYYLSKLSAYLCRVTSSG